MELQAKLTPEFSRQLNDWMKINHLVPVDARDYALLKKAKTLFAVNGSAKRSKPEIVETPWGMIEV
jgi:hypothetical protein